MSSSEFAPLLDAEPARAFRPLGDARQGEAGAGREPAPVAARMEDSDAYRAGVERGRDEVRAEQAALVASLTDAITEFGAARVGLAARWEGPLLGVAVGVARAVVRQELTERPELWLGMLRDGIRRALDRERVVVHAPPALADLLAGSLPEVKAALAEVKELSVVADPSLVDGACVVETRFGDVELGVDAQVEQALRLLQDGDA
jgi:flagellar assembly protein FliH